MNSLHYLREETIKIHKNKHAQPTSPVCLPTAESGPDNMLCAKAGMTADLLHLQYDSVLVFYSSTGVR